MKRPRKFSPHDSLDKLPWLADVFDVADWLECSPAVVRGLIKLRKLEEVKVGRRLRVTRASLAAFARIPEAEAEAAR